MLTIRELKTPLIGPIDLALHAGEAVAVSGPSGAGKSLFLRAIADLDESTGHVALDGTEREAMPAPEWRRKVAYVPAESGWWADRVLDHFTETADLSSLLQQVGLADARSWEVARLSTGERQRLALVRALQAEPQVLLLDEPTSALDPPSVTLVEALVEALLKQQLAAKRALLIVSHDPDQPGRLGARRFVMDKGCLTATSCQEPAA
ncbi:probable ATP-binding protein [Roseibium aggregatum IAM 12614]|uniref:Probable ATP-binding protein n=1 Tax=Roseibium aggregatum (strain ATCC 25650 / DSM 13394 / JCM 20685 / NBRC 16684 / NCIMB 2208 / IAM 12614 / B1) TaxID=384765 RepID=A0NP80_ROSAI|nr:ATP-binding cassette domain-containing protein [Roseibium aggregatum]EAV45243.1 probable ATP-binding protein [Roseibium aggregatum IAM 12614]